MSAPPADRLPTSARRGAPPAGAWHPELGRGDRRFLPLGAIGLESGSTLPDALLAYESWGTLAADGSNAILVLHALTGDSHVIGPAGPAHPTAGWWEDLVGPGRPIDTDRWFVIAPNVLGGCQGSTGPSSTAPDGRAWGSRFPALSVRDQVAAEHALLEHLGLERWALVIGGSMGGMRALEWAVTWPDQVERLAVIASSARASADQIAWNSIQEAVICADAGFAGGDYYELAAGQGPRRGLGIARRIAHTTYRTAHELEERFSNREQDQEDPAAGGRHQVVSYLDHHADKLVARFDANSYLALVRAMSTHDVGRGRGGIGAALGRVRARTLTVAIDSDRLFPPALVEEIPAGIPGARHREVHCDQGHDGFLLPSPELSGWIRDLLTQ